MSLVVQSALGRGKEADRRAIAVQLPNANAGIASALQKSYATLPIDEQFDHLLSRIK